MDCWARSADAELQLRVSPTWRRGYQLARAKMKEIYGWMDQGRAIGWTVVC